MKTSQLQSLVREIVKQFTEMKSSSSEWSVNHDVATFENLELEDGRLVGGQFTLQIDRQDDGIGSYEFWGHKGYDKGKSVHTLEGWELTNAWESDESGKPIRDLDIKDPVNRSVIDALEAEMESKQSEVEDYVSQNPPEPNVPDYERDTDGSWVRT